MLSKTRKTFLILFLCVTVLSIVFSVNAMTISKAAEGNEIKNTVLEIDTSFRTRVTTPLTARQGNRNGGSIAFDLLESDLKSPDNLVGVTIAGSTHTTGVNDAADTLAANLMTLRQWNYAGITFSFHMPTAAVAMTDFNWRSANSLQMGVNEESFTYYADGTILEFFGKYNDGQNRAQYAHKPGDEGTFVGTTEDVAAFMNPGYSYKVSLVWGTVNDDKTITPLVAGEPIQGWYVAYRKTIDALEEDYEVLFAFKLTRPDFLTDYGLGANSQAGFEIHANYANPRSSMRNNGFCTASNNVKMVMDNVAIYDGRNLATAEKKAVTNFETPVDGLELTVENSTVEEETAAAAGGYWGTWVTSLNAAKIKTNTVLVDGLTIQSANAAKGIIEAPATRAIKEVVMHKVEYLYDGEVLATRYVPDGGNITIPQSINGVVYEWLTEGISTTNVTTDLKINAKVVKERDNVLELNTSYRTRVTGELSKKEGSFAGGSIAFDLLESDMKSDENITGVQIKGTDYYTGVGNIDLNYNFMILRFWNYAGITFNFYVPDNLVDMGEFNWHCVAPAASGYRVESFSYYADGSIIEYYGYYNDAANRAQYKHFPGDKGFVGSQEDVAAFMNPGYNYKVSIVWGNVDSNKKITTAENNKEAWYVAYRKAINADDSEYEVLFAFKITNPTSFRTSQTIGGASQAGFEIHANYGNPAANMVDENGYNTASNNVRMVIDNLSIYDGLDRQTAEKKIETGFNGEIAGLNYETDESTLNVSTAKYQGMCGYMDCFKSDYLMNKTNSVEFDGIRIQTTDGQKNIIEGPSSRSVTRWDMNKVEFVCGEEVVLSRLVPNGCAVSLPAEINGVYYEWTQPAGIDLTNITDYVTITGVEKTQSTMSYNVNGGTGTIADAVYDIGATITLPLGEELSKQYYTLIGWTIGESTEVLELGSEYLVTGKDVTFKAVWEIEKYTVQFMHGEELLQTVETPALQSADYTGIIPAEEGKIFIGWDKPINAITESITVNAQFSENYDYLAENKSVKFTLAANDGVDRSELKLTRWLSDADLITVEFDVISGGFAKTYLALAQANVVVDTAMDLTAYITEYKSIKVVATRYNYSIFTKSIDQDEAEYVLQATKPISVERGMGYSGLIFVAANNTNVEVELNNICIYTNEDKYVETLAWDETTVEAAKSARVGTFVNVSANTEVIVTSIDRPRTLQVEFKDNEGNVLVTRKVFVGGNATVPAIKGGIYNAENVLDVQDSQVVEGEITKIDYTVTFVAEGYEFDAIEYNYGDEIMLPTAQNDEIHKEIVGWATIADGIVEYSAKENVVLEAEDMTLYPVWDYVKVTATFKHEDGTVLFTKQVSYLGVPTYAGETPVKEGFVFVGWDKEIRSLTEDTTFTAVFQKIVNKYNVIVNNGQGGGIYNAGEKVVITVDQSSGLEFIEWVVDEGEVEITKDEDNNYSFIMPESNVIISAKFAQEGCNSNVFNEDGLGVLVLLSICCLATLIIKRKTRNANK